MDIRAVAGDVTQLAVDALIINLFEGVQEPKGATGAVDRVLEGAISRLIAEGEITGKKGETALVHTLGKLAPRRVLVVGLGKEKDFNLDVVRFIMGEACRALRKIRAERIATIAHGAGIGGLSPQDSAQGIAEGALLGLYTFKKYITKDEEATREIKELLIVEREESKLPALERGIALGKVLAQATMLCRDMVNEPANIMTPRRIAQIAREIAQEHGLEFKLLERPQMEELGMGALLGVAKGSVEPPQFIVLGYKGDPRPGASSVALIGKTITFDSGGISLKPAEGMAEMKGDMAGGAAVIAAMKAIAQLKPSINVYALAPAAENLPSGSAQRPGDVVRAMNGKTIEVENTDAEGRLTLADALCYARQMGVQRLVDVATLTGAVRIALGSACTGVMGNDPDLIDRVIKAGERAGEKMWQLPLYEEYKEQIKSQVADVKNVGGRLAGAITAAQFLSEFAEDTPWVHLDIAGTSMTDKERGYQVKGATGVPVRTLVHLVLGLAQGPS